MARQYSRSITVDHTQVPNTDQTNFPVLVSITDSALRTVGNGGHVQNSNGYDIGFFSDSGGSSALFWEVERYNGTSGELVAWVKIPSLSHTTDTVFYIFYGDNTISTFQSTASSVWDSNYLAVYHLPDGSSLSLLDSTTNATNGTGVNTPTATTGQIDGGLNLVHSSTQYVDLSNVINPTAISITAWAKGASFPSGYNVVFSRNVGGTSYFQLFVKSDGKLAVFSSAGSGNPTYDGTGSHTLSTGTWYHLAATYDSSAGLVGYVNAASDGTAAAAGNLTTSTAGSRIGSDSNTGGREWDGVIDELRVSNSVRSADWITTEYNNHNSPGTFLSFGAEQGAVVTFPDWMPRSNIPIFDRGRRQYTDTFFWVDAKQLTQLEINTIATKWWRQPTERVRSVKRLQYLYPSFFISPHALTLPTPTPQSWIFQDYGYKARFRRRVVPDSLGYSVVPPIQTKTEVFQADLAQFDGDLTRMRGKFFRASLALFAAIQRFSLTTMAKEITAGASLAFAKSPELGVSVSKSGVTFDVSGSRYTRLVMTIPTSATALDLGDITSPGWYYIANLDTTNYCDIMTSTGGAAFLRLKPGEFSIGRFAVAAPAAQANTGSVQLEYLIIEA